MELPLSKWDHDYCGIPPEGSKSRTRFLIPSNVGFEQVRFKANNFQESFQGDLGTRHQPVCFDDVS